MRLPMYDLRFIDNVRVAQICFGWQMYSKERERNNNICIKGCAAIAIFVFGNRHVINRLERLFC